MRGTTSARMPLARQSLGESVTQCVDGHQPYLHKKSAGPLPECNWHTRASVLTPAAQSLKKADRIRY